MINRHYVNAEDDDVRSHISTIIHEVLHALFFSPGLYPNFKKNSKGETFIFKDDTNRYRMRGDTIVAEAKKHFGCDSIESGTVLYFGCYLDSN